MPKAEFGDKIMPFGDHLEELRSRLIYALLGVLPILVVSLVIGKSVLNFLLHPIAAALEAGGLPRADGAAALMDAVAPLWAA